MRSISSGEAVNYTGIGILLLYLLVFTVAASWFIYKKKNLYLTDKEEPVLLPVLFCIRLTATQKYQRYL